MTESLFFPKNIKPICEICISTPIHIDQNLFKYWLKGETINQITRRKLEKQKDIYSNYIFYVVSSQKVSTEVAEKQLEMFVENQLQNTFRNFSLLSRFLSCPEMLRNQTVFSIDQKNCVDLINQYYEVEGAVMRELLSNRFKQSKNRKKTLAEKCGKPAIVCKRVESNFERIYKFASQLTEGNVLELIQNEFLLPIELAQKYERILFICYHKFDVSKKRIENLTYSRFDLMVRSMISWCDETTVGFDRFQIDKNFSEKLKLVKNLLQTKEIVDEMKQYILNGSDPVGQILVPIPPEKKARLERETPRLIVAIASLGANLDQPREFKDFFVDIIGKIHDPLRERDLNKKEVTTFFTKLRYSFLVATQSRESISPNQKKKFNAAWHRYIECMQYCITANWRKKKN